MKQKRLSLYQIDIKYIRDLAKKDKNVMSVSPQINKESRPFVGVLIICDTIIIGKYKNREQAFLLQNMFPVTEKYIDHIDTTRDVV